MKTVDLINEILKSMDRLIQNIRKLYNTMKNRNKIFKPKSKKKI